MYHEPASTLLALSIQHPRADQILRPAPQPNLGQKWCENRSWSTLHRGRLLIHRSGPGGAIQGEVQLLDVINSYGRDDETPRQAIRRLRRTVRTIYASAGLPPPTTWTCTDPFCGTWWLLAHPVRYRTPIPCSGRLRLWRPSDAVARIVEQSARDTRTATQNSRSDPCVITAIWP